MIHIERYQHLLSLTGQSTPKDRQYISALYALAFNESLFSIASNPGMVTSDGINFSKMRRQHSHDLSESDYNLLVIAHNLFSAHSSCPENPYWILSQLPAPHYICALRTIGIMSGKLDFTIEHGEFVFSEAPLIQQLHFYEETEKMWQSLLER